jgi:hypothetical protein
MGDLLITEATIKYLRQEFPSAEFQTIWRESTHDEDFYKAFDVIVFACFAVRKNIISIYPDLPKILSSRTQTMYLACGTNISLEGVDGDIGFSSSDIGILRNCLLNAAVSWSRGRLTETVFRRLGLDVPYCGDIVIQAFPEIEQDKPLTQIKSVNESAEKTSVYVSDPHYLAQFEESFITLIQSLQEDESIDISIVQHGKNPGLDDLCVSLEVPIIKAFESKDKWNVYRQCDVHIGYRIHGFLPALLLGKKSALIAQDGRGLDYWMSLPGDSIRLGLPYEFKLTARNLVKALLKGKMPKSSSFVYNSPPGIAVSLAQEFRRLEMKELREHYDDCLRSQNNRLSKFKSDFMSLQTS